MTKTHLITFMAFLLAVQAGSAFGVYSGGTGDPNTPYQIVTKADLLALAANTADYDKCFILTANVNMQGRVFTQAIIAASSSNPFSGTAFTGTFDGNGHKISGFLINGGPNSYLGLFGQINSGGSVKNLGLENFVVVSGSSYVGGLAGCNNGGSVSNCYSTGEVNGSGNYVGGLVGYYSGSSINNCYSTGAVSGYEYVGGLVGYYSGGSSISSCYSTGAVNGSSYYSYVGGLVGYYSGGNISNCYATGNVSGRQFTGGLVAQNDGSISNCYSTGSVSSDNYFVGGLVGYNNGSINNCYSSTGTVSGGWGYVGGLVGINSGSGSISNCHSMDTVSNSTNVGGLVGENDGGISNCYSSTPVSGTSNVGGLVGHNSLSIENCSSTSQVSGSSSVGGLVGDNYGGSIENCSSTGSVSGSSGIGGLVGSNNSGSSISNCYSTGTVSGSSGSQYVGGLVGYNSGSSIDICYSTGSVNGTSYVGGLVGDNDGGITNCYSSMGAVSGSSDIGGLVGKNTNFIIDCYSTGYIIGSSYVGGLVGENTSLVWDSFWDTQSSGKTTSAGGTGKTTAQMKTLSTFTSADWDFTTIWAIFEGTNYPWLMLMTPVSTITTSPTPPPNTPGNALKPVNPTTTPPSGQLKRWDGQSWQPVTSWDDTNIHTEQPTVVIAHGWKTDDSNFFSSDSRNSEMAVAFYMQDSSANILAWDWQDQAVSWPGEPLFPALVDIAADGLYGAANSANNGSIEGVNLAHELQNLNIDIASLQLIGHSNGGAVVGAAASELALGGQKVKRITTLDTPNLSLGELPVAWVWPIIDSKLLSTSVNAMQYVDVSSASQVEVYYSGLGAGRHAFGFGALLSASSGNNRFNGMIYPGNVTNPLDINQWDHFRIIDWYCGKDRTPVIAGIDWSILSTHVGDFNDGTYAEQSFNSGVFGQFTPAQLQPVTWKKIWWDGFDTGSDVIRNWFGQHAELFICGDIENAVAKIISGSDGYLWKDVSVPGDAYYLTFDLKVETPGAGDFLTVSLGTEVIYYKSLNTADSDFWTVDPIFIGNFAGQTETLLFTLNHVGDGTPSILLDNITFSATLMPPRPMTVDLNNDGIPNFYDFSYFAMFWQNASCSEPNWCEGRDFNHDGVVDVKDLQIFTEFWLWPVADVDMDGAVNFTDYAIFADNWTDDTCCAPNWCGGTDFDHSGSVDMLDLATFARYWLEGL